MTEDIIKLTKFDVAERQLNQAIALFFSRGDVVSIHTLAEAAGQVLYDIRSQFGGVSILRDSDYIREEYKNEWLAHMFKSRNFFKHANRDGSNTHEFKDIFNHYSLLDATNLYLTAKKAWTPESLLFISWFSLSYPHLIKEDSDMSTYVAMSLTGPNKLDPTDLATLAECLNQLRAGKREIPGLILTPGIP